MIPNSINQFDDLVPYLEELGFIKYVEIHQIIKYKYDTDKKIIKLNYELKLIPLSYKDDIFISTVYNRLNNTYLNDHNRIYGYLAVINCLNDEFKEYFRKKKIKKLLND